MKPSFFLRRGLTFFSIILFALGISFFSSQQQAFSKTLRMVPQRFFQKACGLSVAGFARCHAQVVTDSHNEPLASATVPSGSYGPVQFHSAYNLPCTPGGSVSSTCATPFSFGPQTIAIVDAYNDPTVENDLTVYSTAFGIPPCTKANGCLTVINQNGGSSLPSTNSGWALEIALDTQVAHTICQTCKILLVEANSSSILDLGTAVNRAAAMGATVISNSYGGSEWSGETFYDTYYNHPGIAVTASSGDSGYGVEYPAASPKVTAVGGTTLQLFTDNTYASESVWNGTGSGCSSYESANVWQTSLPNWAVTNCGIHRAIADISADADPNTGAAVYDSTPYSGQSGWWIVGGTSLSSPLIASVYALTGSLPANTNEASLLYQNSTLFHDVLSGSNGNCLTIMCKGAIGYDGPSGLGTPNGLNGFLVSPITPVPTDTPTPTSGPTATPTPTTVPSPTDTPTPTPVDTQAPAVTITNPLNNALVSRGSRVTISATASDNIKVTKVEFYINNSLLSTDTTSPYSTSWRVPFTRNVPYTITAKAYDPSNNVGTASITVTSR